MKPLIGSFLALTILCGCQPAARMMHQEPHQFSPRFVSHSPYSALKSELDALLPDSLFPPASVGIKVVSLSRNETLYEANPSLLFMPASNQKLFTCTAALATLGKDFPLNTCVYIDTASGPAVFVKGFGDPLFSTADIDSIVSRVSLAVAYDRPIRVVGDVSYFDDLYWGQGWMWDDEPDPDAMFITPLSVNGNTIKVSVRPGIRPGEPATVTTDPETRYVTIESSALTVVDSITTPINVSRNWRNHTNVITVSGQVRLGDTVLPTSISVWRPEGYTLALLAERLQARGFQLAETQLDTLAQTASEIWRVSHSLDSVVAFSLKRSDNLAAENILKILGAHEIGTPGTASNGISIVKRFLLAGGIDTTQLSLVDGSGISRYNLASADQIVQLLQTTYRTPQFFEVVYNALPVAGVDGSLRNRMTGTPAQGHLRAKTGTLRGISAFSGYVRTGDGELLAFSILMQNFTGDVKTYRNVQDSIGRFLSGLKREKL